MTKSALKKLKRTYYFYLLGIVVFMILSAIAINVFGLVDSYIVVDNQSIIKTVQMIITLFGIPGVFGLFTKQIETIKTTSDIDKKTQYVKSSKLRLKVVAAIFILNALVYFLISEQSQLIMVAISAFVFLFIRPSENRISGDLGLEDGISDNNLEE